jgi:SpoVK/Ycf46/Vps4 family AAA+-type ATPase
MNIINKQKEGVDHYEKMGTKYFFGKPSESFSKLEAGIYTINVDKSGSVFLDPMSAMTDTLIRLPEFTSEKIIKEVEKFWSTKTKAKFSKRKLVYKRGIILHGKPGVGKSACVAQIMEAEVNSGGIVLFAPSPNLLHHVMKCIREIENIDRRCLVVWEEFDSMIDRNESEFLSLLDGEMQINNVVYLATTNYLDRIPNRFKNRPSRFASIIEVGLPNDATRRAYLENKIYPEDKINLEDWVKATDGLTIDHIKDLIISVLCLDIPLQEAVDRLTKIDYTKEDDNDIESKRDRQRRQLMENLFLNHNYSTEGEDDNDF